MAINIVYKFEYEELYSILSGDTELSNVLLKYNIASNSALSKTFLNKFSINQSDVENKLEDYFTELRIRKMSELLLNNRDLIASKTIEEIMNEEFLFSDIGLIFELDYLPIPVYHQIYYSYKYSTIKNFFRQNYEHFLPEVDYFYIQSQEKLKLFVESILKEMDHFSDVIDKLYNLPDIDSIPNEYVKYLAQLIGYEREDSLLLQDASYRELVKNIIEIYKIKGTNYSFELFMNFLGFDINLYEYWFDRRLFYTKKSKNDFTGIFDKNSSYFYLTPNKPTDIAYDFLYRNESVSDGDISGSRNLYEFNRLAESGVLLDNLLGYSNLDGEGNLYTGKTFTYFKTNIVDYNLKKIKITIKENAEEISSTDLIIINKYIDFLTPIFVIRNIMFGLNEYSDGYFGGSGTMPTNLNIPGVSFSQKMFYSINQYLNYDIIPTLYESLLQDRTGIYYFYDPYKYLIRSSNIPSFKSQTKLKFDSGAKNLSKKIFSPLLNWPLEYDAKDTSSYGNYGTISGSGGVFLDTGLNGKSFSFSGIERIYSSLNNTIFDNNYSISVWVYFLNNDESLIIDSSALPSTTGGGISLKRNTSKKIVFTHYKLSGTPSSITSIASIPINTWINIVITWSVTDYTKRYICLNGVLDAAVSTNNGAGVSGSYYLTVGGCGNPSNTSNRLVGYSKDVKVFDKLLSIKEIETNYDIDRGVNLDEIYLKMKNIISPFNYFKMGSLLPDYPNNSSGMLDFDDFKLIGTYTVANANEIVDGSISRVTGSSLADYPIYHKAISGMVVGKKVYAKIRVSSGVIGNMRVGNYSEFSGSYSTVSLNNTRDWQIKSITLSSDFSILGFSPNDAARSGNNVEVDWIYVGDGTSSNILINSGSSANNGIFTDLSLVDGAVNKGCSFNGTTSVVNLNSAYTFGSSKTIMFWLKVAANNVTKPIFYDTVIGDGYIGVDNSSILISKDVSTASWSNVIFNDNRFHHYAIVRDSGITAILYLDGISMGSLAFTGDTTISKIGSDGSLFFAGSLDEIYTIESALTFEEVMAYFNSVKNRIDNYSNALNLLKLIPYIKDEIDIQVKKI